MFVRPYSESDVPEMVEIWNAVVEDALAFPQEEKLTPAAGKEFFSAQSCCGVAERDGKIAGLYIVHPNNVGRCGHIANASYAVRDGLRGAGIGRALVLDSLARAAELGFRIMQFNAVTKNNMAARKLYESLGFMPLGHIPGGFRRADGTYEEINLYYRALEPKGS